MATDILWSGNVTDDRSPSQNVVGMTLNLERAVVSGGPWSTVDTEITDSNGDYSGSYTYIAGGLWFRINPTALTPHFADPGLGTAELAVDTGTDYGLVPQNFTAAFSNTNPTKGTIGAQSYTENTGNKTAGFSMSDSDSGDVLTPIKVSAPTGFSVVKVSNSLGELHTNTNVVPVGVHQAQVRVDDDWGGFSSTETAFITITSANSPPTLTGPPDRDYFNNSGDQTLQLTATDPDDDPLTYSRQSGPAWGTVTPAGLITFDTNVATRGAFVFTWKVEDGQGGSDSKSHTVNINNNVPVITDPGSQNYTKNTGVQDLQLATVDLDLDTIVYSKDSGDANITVSTTGLVQSDTDALTEATHAVQVSVDDGNGGADITNFNIVVGTPDPRPEFVLVG